MLSLFCLNVGSSSVVFVVVGSFTHFFFGFEFYKNKKKVFSAQTNELFKNQNCCLFSGVGGRGGVGGGDFGFARGLLRQLLDAFGNQRLARVEFVSTIVGTECILHLIAALVQ